MSKEMFDGLILTDFLPDRPGMHQRVLGGYAIASLLRNRNLNVQVIDFINQLPDSLICDIVNRFVSDKTKFIGISETFMHSVYPVFSKPELHQKIDFFIKKAKEISPDIKVIQGGASSFYKYKMADIVFGGQNKESEFLNYISTLFSNIDASLEFVQEPFQFSKSDFILLNETLPIEISRGCIFSCKFCGFYGRGKKKNEFFKNPALLKQQFIKNYENFRTTNYFLADDTFNESTEKLTQILNITETLEFRPRFVCYARLDLIWAYPVMIDQLYQIGVRAIVFGIETLDTKAGAKIGKGLGFQRIQETLKMIREKYPDIYLSSGFIIGLPEEQKDSFKRTFDWLLHSKLLNNWNFYGLKIDNISDDSFKSQFSKEIESYGYTRMGAHGWRRADLDSNEAEAIAQQFNNLSNKHSGLFPWTLFNLLKDNSFDELKLIKNSDFWSLKNFSKLEEYQRLVLTAAKNK